MNRRQTARLARLGDWLHASGRTFLFELLVPAEPHQLERVGGDADRYDRELRPGLMIAAIRECQAAGVEPDIWKIEGLEERADCVRLAEAARAEGREHVTCVVLGRGGECRMRTTFSPHFSAVSVESVSRTRILSGPPNCALGMTSRSTTASMVCLRALSSLT